MTSRHALDHFSARHTRRNIKIGFLRTSEEEIFIILSVSQRTCKILYQGKRCSAAFCGYKVRTVDCCFQNLYW